MRTDKPDEHIPHYKLYYYDKPVFVPLDVKHIVLITHGIDITKICLDIRKRMPLSGIRYFIPSFQCDL